METIWQLGIEAVLFFQQWAHWLKTPMEAISFLGTEEFFIFLAPVIYWCISAKAGLWIGLILSVSGSINFILKIAFHGPRPYWYDPRVAALASETSFGLPSGHSQNAAAVWGAAASLIKRRWAWAAAIFITALIGVSRMVLGVHFPSDVFVGWAAGAVLVGFAGWMRPRLGRELAKLSAWKKTGAAFGFSMILILLGVSARWALSDWEIPSRWIELSITAYPAIEITPLSLSGLITSSGVFFGMAAGAIWLAGIQTFDAHGKWWQLLLRYLLGLAGIMVLWVGLGAVFPRAENGIAYSFRFVRYALIGGWISGAAPWLFIRLGLANRPA